MDEKVPTSIEIAACLKDCVLKLNKYFEGKKTEFEFTIHPKATTFQLKVWKSLLQIPCVKTISH